MKVLIGLNKSFVDQMAQTWMQREFAKGIRDFFIPAGGTPEGLYGIWNKDKPEWLNETFLYQVDDIVDEQVLQMRKLLKTNLEDLDLSVRAYNCLKAAKINGLDELVKFNTNDLLKFRNFGKKSLVEIEAMLIEKGLSFGMDISKYQLDEN